MYEMFLVQQMFYHNAGYLFMIVSKHQFVTKLVSKERKAYMFLFARDALHKKNKTTIDLVSFFCKDKAKNQKGSWE